MVTGHVLGAVTLPTRDHRSRATRWLQDRLEHHDDAHGLHCEDDSPYLPGHDGMFGHWNVTVVYRHE